jgi:hypothetical protein
MAHRVRVGWLLVFVMAKIGNLMFPCSGRVFAWCGPRCHRRPPAITPIQGFFDIDRFSNTRRLGSFSAHSRIFSSSSRRDLAPASSEINSDSQSNDFPTPTYEQDTIYALSSGYTGLQATALAVIRISGPQAHDVLAALTPTKPLPKPRFAALRKIYYQNQMLDHALVLRFNAPNSFTGEDLIELQCHGSRAVVQGLLDTLPKIHSCRYAQAGEFTQRAYANGKLDLVQGESE